MHSQGIVVFERCSSEGLRLPGPVLTHTHIPIQELSFQDLCIWGHEWRFSSGTSPETYLKGKEEETLKTLFPYWVPSTIRLFVVLSSSHLRFHKTSRDFLVQGSLSSENSSPPTSVWSIWPFNQSAVAWKKMEKRESALSGFRLLLIDDSNWLKA